MTQKADSLRGRRQHFAAPGGFHDRMVKFVAVGLPAAIGALLAVLVIAPLPRGTSASCLIATRWRWSTIGCAW